ncbi:hypothetical protein C8Q76DRAFT_669462 [Earliella scabrosa]|nr:hypothetical protein C8Q76DRAFT_669462 [Earliella scabrosa]
MRSGGTAQMHRPPGKPASAPFDRHDADFIIRSSDNVDFHVHRIILSLASSVFSDMLPLPQPEGSSPIPTVDLEEDSQTIDVFLRVCYPLFDPEIKTLPELRKVLAAAIKYDAQIVVHAMKKTLVSPPFLQKEPMNAYAVACLFDLEEEAKIAAEVAATNQTQVSTYQLLDEISAGAYYRILKLRRVGPRHIKPVPSKSRKGVHTSPQCSFNHVGIAPFCRPATSLASSKLRPKLDAVTHPFIAADADMILRTSDSLDFRVHRAILSLASPMFIETLAKEQCAKPEGEDDLPLYTMREDGAVVDALLRFCYPLEVPQLTNANLLLEVAFSAKKYGLHRAEQLIRASSAWSTFSASAPLKFYFAAVRMGWKEEAKTCALRLTQTHTREQIVDLYIPEMEAVCSRLYRRFLDFDKACRDAMYSDFELSGLGDRLCTPLSSPCRDRYRSTPATYLRGCVSTQ